MITTTHIFYIPALLIVGFIIGYVVGRSLLYNQLEAAEKELDSAPQSPSANTAPPSDPA